MRPEDGGRCGDAAEADPPSMRTTAGAAARADAGRAPTPRSAPARPPTPARAPDPRRGADAEAPEPTDVAVRPGRRGPGRPPPRPAPARPAGRPPPRQPAGRPRHPAAASLFDV